jgi:hypothetical protein
MAPPSAGPAALAGGLAPGARYTPAMAMKNHPNDTIAKRLLRRSPGDATGWIAGHYPVGDERDALTELVRAYRLAGSPDVLVGEIDDGDQGPRLRTLVVRLPENPAVAARVKARSLELERQRGVEEPGEGHGYSWLLVPLRPEPQDGRE